MTQERERRSILITEDFDGERVDSALAKILELSRSTVADLLNSGDVLQGKNHCQSQIVSNLEIDSLL